MKRIIAVLGLGILSAADVVAQGQARTNDANHSPTEAVNARIAPNTDTNSIRTTTAEQFGSEERLREFFPQLLWSRDKLEFICKERRKLATDLGAGGNSEDEAFKVAKDMEGTFNRDNPGPTFKEALTMLKEGLKMAGPVQTGTANFSKTNYTLNGITGEVEILFDQDKLISFSFWTDGTDAAFGSLYRVIVAACNSNGKRVSYGKDHSEINWTITGMTNHYNVQLSHRDWGGTSGVERGMTILVKHAPFDSASAK